MQSAVLHHKALKCIETRQAAPIRWVKGLDFLCNVLVNHAVERNVHGIKLWLESVDFLRLRSAQYCAETCNLSA